jgi:hypothetical protein
MRRDQTLRVPIVDLREGIQTVKRQFAGYTAVLPNGDKEYSWPRLREEMHGVYRDGTQPETGVADSLY